MPRSSLTRSHHSVTTVDKKAYIFGGLTSQGRLASADLHSIALEGPTVGPAASQYQLLPAIPVEKGGPIPSPRHSHAACALGSSIVVIGGRDENERLLDDGHQVWMYDTEKLAWDTLEPPSHLERLPPPRSEAKLFHYDSNLVLYGGKGEHGSFLADAWHFDSSAKTWNQLPTAPVATTSAALFGNILYLISGSDDLSSQVHILEIKLYSEQPSNWRTLSFPTNPLVPGPRPRENGGLLPVTTGYGRNFLLYFLGARQEPTKLDQEGASLTGDRILSKWDDVWTFQLPSGNVEFKTTNTISEAVKPAKIKDQIRLKLGIDTGNSSWAEVDIHPPEKDQRHEGKINPGPRSHFGCCLTTDGRGVVVWGGLDAEGRRCGDGWIIQLH